MSNFNLEVSSPPPQPIGTTELVLHSDANTTLRSLNVFKSAGATVTGHINSATRTGTVNLPAAKYTTLVTQCGGNLPVMVTVICDANNNATDFISVVETTLARVSSIAKSASERITELVRKNT